jgi:hypothetical protein
LTFCKNHYNSRPWTQKYTHPDRRVRRHIRTDRSSTELHSENFQRRCNLSIFQDANFPNTPAPHHRPVIPRSNTLRPPVAQPRPCRPLILQKPQPCHHHCRLNLRQRQDTPAGLSSGKRSSSLPSLEKSRTVGSGLCLIPDGRSSAGRFRRKPQPRRRSMARRI